MTSKVSPRVAFTLVSLLCPVAEAAERLTHQDNPYSDGFLLFPELKQEGTQTIRLGGAYGMNSINGSIQGASVPLIKGSGTALLGLTQAVSDHFSIGGVFRLDSLNGDNLGSATLTSLDVSAAVGLTEGVTAVLGYVTPSFPYSELTYQTTSGTSFKFKPFNPLGRAYFSLSGISKLSESIQFSALFGASYAPLSKENGTDYSLGLNFATAVGVSLSKGVRLNLEVNSNYINQMFRVSPQVTAHLSSGEDESIVLGLGLSDCLRPNSIQGSLSYRFFIKEKKSLQEAPLNRTHPEEENLVQPAPQMQEIELPPVNQKTNEATEPNPDGAQSKAQRE